MRIGYGTMTTRTLSLLLLSLAFSSVPPVIAGQFGTPKENEGVNWKSLPVILKPHCRECE